MTAKKKNTKDQIIGTVRASRGGHTFHERWAARRALQLVFPKDGLKTIAVEGLSSNERVTPSDEAEEVADLVLYYDGDNFETSTLVQTAQFKYKTSAGHVTASYLRKTIEKFAGTITWREETFSPTEVDKRLSFSFVTNAEFSSDLWEAIAALKNAARPTGAEALRQHDYLADLCKSKGIDAERLFSRTEFRAAEEDLPAQTNKLRRMVIDWSGDADNLARSRMYELTELMRNKAGPGGEHNNLVAREDVLNALGCDPEDLFPADIRFIDVGQVVERKQLADVSDLIATSLNPVFIHADGGIGKTVFVESLASTLLDTYEVVVFDCFGGGAYRSPDQARHRPDVGFVQIVNELASRGLCDPLLPGETESVALARAARRRFAQAAGAIKSQSKKHGVLIVIDAADNAQEEANDRKEDAFPSLLLASLDGQPIDGIKLVLTARTHRMGKVIKRSKVTPFPLLPFSREEAHAFLAARRECLSEAEFAVAFSRSGGNARVLAYLVDTWDVNVRGNAPDSKISVEELIAQKCQKIIDDLHVAAWPDEKVLEFFAAISLLPPPMPVDELAAALGWELSEVRTAASDLAPMLELIPRQGAIFRDEPTETYVRDTYSKEPASQQAIAERLHAAQGTSSYAAEALPSFLVAINDSARSYALAYSTQFPSIIQSDFGRRRLQLARLSAAFKLAVKEENLDRILKLAMRLAQVAAANSRGDEFIRRSPGLAVALGDPDAYRRLFVDRSGWRGARDARLTVAHAFFGELEEAKIHTDRTIGWINWNAKQNREEREPGAQRTGPEAGDFASAVLVSILTGHYETLDDNLIRWNRAFALSVCREALKLTREYECVTGNSEIDDLAAFAGSAKSKSFVLKVSLLKMSTLRSEHRRKIAKSLARMPIDKVEAGERYDPDNVTDADVIYASFAALLHDGPNSAAKILRSSRDVRASSHDYGDRYRYSKAWLPTLRACTSAWSQCRKVAIHDFLPNDVKLTAKAKALSSSEELRNFLATLPAPRRRNYDGTLMKRTKELQFNERDCREITRAIETLIQIVQPVEAAVLSGSGLKPEALGELISDWTKQLPSADYGHEEEAHTIIRRVVCLGFSRLLLQHLAQPSVESVEGLLKIIRGKRFSTSERSRVLGLIAAKPGMESVSGQFAKEIAKAIRKDDYIEQRGEDYSALAKGLLEMSVSEAKRYYRDGLAELDKLGSNDYELIYSLLEYAATQAGGEVSPALGQRLMNLAQTIFNQEPGKFGWALFGRACAKSVGTTAITKLIRWADQDVAEYSYGLPQLVCFLAAEGKLDASRATALLLLCKDHGWHEWRIGDGMRDLLGATADRTKQRQVAGVIVKKLKHEHINGGWPSVWQSLLDVAAEFPGVLDSDEIVEITRLLANAERERDESNARSSGRSSNESSFASTRQEADPISLIEKVLRTIDVKSASALDVALRTFDSDKTLPHNTSRRFFQRLRESCPYNDRTDLLLAICEASEIEINDAVDFISAAIADWRSSSNYVVSDAKRVLTHLFEEKGSQLFELRYSSLVREIKKLEGICADGPFVLHLILSMIVTERLELDAKEWFELATILSTEATPVAAREALEDFLSGPAAGIAEGVGEGPYKDSFRVENNAILPAVYFHLLGDTDAYARWNTARALEGVVALGLAQDLVALVEGFDHRSIPALESPDLQLAFENSQQWLLMGIARAALYSPETMKPLEPTLLELSLRDDIHIINKRHILRSLVNLGAEEVNLVRLRHEVADDPLGTVEAEGWPKDMGAKSGFEFGYDFMKSEVSRLARLFWISDGESTDAIAAEIKRKWPDATSMEYFPGRERYKRERNDRYESFRENVQKHAVIGAATTLRKSRPVARQYYDTDGPSPFEEFMQDYDVSFADGSWLADHKDDVPLCANINLSGPRVDKKDTLIDLETALRVLELEPPGSMVPIYGTWKSPDGVYVRIVTGLGQPRGIIGRCEAFSKGKEHRLWIPTFWHDGHDDEHRDDSPFEPFIWAQENYGLGVDAGDKEATGGAASRPRLGVPLTGLLDLVPDAETREWRTGAGEVALVSQVWGERKPDPDDYRTYLSDDGEILWANADWLERALSTMGKQLVYEFRMTKYKERRSYRESGGAKAVYVATRKGRAPLRVWHAKKASAEVY